LIFSCIGLAEDRRQLMARAGFRFPVAGYRHLQATLARSSQGKGDSRVLAAGKAIMAVKHISPDMRDCY
jgi:hypothetical protein